MKFLKNSKLDELVGKEIVITNFKYSTELGTVFTENHFDYNFIFRFFENCIGSVTLREKVREKNLNLELDMDYYDKSLRKFNEPSLKYIAGNIFSYNAKSHGTMFYHGGKNPYSISKKKDYMYDKLSNFIDAAITKKNNRLDCPLNMTRLVKLIKLLPQSKTNSLVGKKITLTDLNSWTRVGTIWTDEGIEPEFIYRDFDRCISRVSLDLEPITHLKGNIYYFNASKEGVYYSHGGKSPLHLTKTVDKDYKELSSFLDESRLKK